MKYFHISFLFLLNLIKSKDLFEDYYEEAEKILKGMTRNEIIGQIFLPRYSLDTADSEIRKYSPGGFILFANNLVNHTEQQLIEELNKRKNISKIPLVFGVDEEGGTVCRISLYFRKEKFPSPRESYLEGGIDKILSIEQEKRDLLRKLNFNFNLAPVADISLNSSDYIYKRTLGENASTTSNYINSVVDSYNDDNFTCCLKHFPGYGNNINTHDDIAHDYRPIDYLKNNDLIPFVNAVSHNVPMIMISHNIVVDIDGEYPSSISKKVHDLLRNEYKYTGLILTDSLSMGAITKYTKNVSAAVLAVSSGNDLIVTSTFEQHINELLTAVNNSEVDMSLIEKAAKRVIAWKLKYIYGKKNKDEDDDDDDKFPKIILYLILPIGIIGIIILIIWIIFRFKKNKENDEKLLNNSDNEQIQSEKE